MKRVLSGVVLLIAIASAVLIANPVSAHVLIKSTDNTKAAILHIMPDDDPIAGETATLLFDTQGEVLADTAKVTLTIKDQSTQKSETVTTVIDGSLVSSKYIFPTQGAYQLTYTIQSTEGTYEFEQTMRVSRGVNNGNITSSGYGWAEALLFIVGALIVLLGIIAWNYRKSIFNSSVL